jgi:hypothetical protein
MAKAISRNSRIRRKKSGTSLLQLFGGHAPAYRSKHSLGLRARTTTLFRKQPVGSRCPRNTRRYCGRRCDA